MPYLIRGHRVAFLDMSKGLALGLTLEDARACLDGRVDEVMELHYVQAQLDRVNALILEEYLTREQMAPSNHEENLKLMVYAAACMIIEEEKLKQ